MHWTAHSRKTVDWKEKKWLFTKSFIAVHDKNLNSVYFLHESLCTCSTMKQRTFPDYSWFNKFLLHTCGALPLKTQNFAINILFLLVPFVATGFLALPAFYSLIFRWNRLTAIDRMDLLSAHIENIVGAIKGSDYDEFAVCVLIPKREKLFKLTKSCENLWKSVIRDEDLETVESYAMRGLYLTYGFAFNVFTALLSLLVTPLFTSFVVDSNGTVLVSKELPYAAGIFHENIRQFNVWHVLQIPAGFATIIPIIAVDTATAFFVLHACAHMTLCQKMFRRIAKDFMAEKPLAMIDSEWSTKRIKIFKDIVKCVTHHQDVLRYSEDIEAIFGPVVLVQTLLSISAICGYAYSLLVEEEMKEQVRYLIHLIGAALQLLIYCWPPDNLQDESTKVAEAAYDLPWYDWTSVEGTLVCIVIARSQKYVAITAGRFAVISLETFSSILSTAFSIFTLLLKVLK